MVAMAAMIITRMMVLGNKASDMICILIVKILMASTNQACCLIAGQGYYMSYLNQEHVR